MLLQACMHCPCRHAQRLRHLEKHSDTQRKFLAASLEPYQLCVQIKTYHRCAGTIAVLSVLQSEMIFPNASHSCTVMSEHDHRHVHHHYCTEIVW